MGILDYIFGKNANTETSDGNFSLKSEREVSFKNAKNEIYNSCFSSLQRQVEVWYKKNARGCSISVTNDTGVVLDKDTIHKVLTKASYDVASNLNIRYSENPSIIFDASTKIWSISVSWE